MRQILIPGQTTYDIIFKNDQPVGARVGGSQLNTAVSLGRMGLPVQFISQVGEDKIGDIAAAFLEFNGVKTDSFQRHQGNSRVALAFLDQDNNADYEFFQAAGSKALSYPEPSSNDVILFGSSFALDPVQRANLLEFLVAAKQAGAIVLYDPNFRSSQKSKMKALLPMIEENLRMSSIVKGSDEDFTNIFGTKTAWQAWQVLQGYQPEILFHTAGREGVDICSSDGTIHCDVPEITPVSTIGAGDNFNAGLIYHLMSGSIVVSDLPKLNRQQLIGMADSGTRFAQHVCQQYDNYVSENFSPRQQEVF